MLVWGHGPAREQPLDCWQVETPRPLQGRANGCLRENRYERQLFRSARNGDAAVTPHRALVVEHDPEVIDVISEALESLEHTFDTACSQREAVKRLRETSYSYVLLDIDIPARSRTGAPRIQNTENLLEKITELKNGDSPPVIILSDYEANGLDATENVMRLAMSLSDKGASDIIKKPFATAGRTCQMIRLHLTNSWPSPASLEARRTASSASGRSWRPPDMGPSRCHPLQPHASKVRRTSTSSMTCLPLGRDS